MRKHPVAVRHDINSLEKIFRICSARALFATQETNVLRLSDACLKQNIQINSYILEFISQIIVVLSTFKAPKLDSFRCAFQG